MIDRLKEAHPEVSERHLCRMFSVSRSWYYGKPTAAEQKARKDLDLRDAIEHIVLEFPGYGYRRVTAELHGRGWTVNHKRVLSIMRRESLLCQLKRRFRPTTDSAHSFGVYPNLIKDTQLDGLDQAWISDITYVRLPTSFCYLAAILDAYSRRCLGWRLSRSIDTSLTLSALEMALATRRPSAGLIHHSDRGVQGGFNRSKQHPGFRRCGMGRPKGWSSTMTGRKPIRSPGRPGISRDVQRLFWARVAEGLTSEDAAGDCGVSSVVGTRWFRESGGMPQINLTVSGRYLSLAEREEIALMRARDVGVREIARRLGRSASTISSA